MDSHQKKQIRGYQLIDRIGKGGFGEVYRAYQPTIGREVAIKVIMPEHANQADFIRNFETEAKLVARLEHPFIIPLFDYWREPSGAYIVMRYLRGGTLKEEMEKGQMELARIADILDNLCSALWTAHRNRVAHRDIKPVNIILDDDRHAYLSDFGLAIIVGNDHYENLVGTWLYMSPERIQNNAQSHTVDVYSLGIMVFEMIAGQYPFVRSSINKLAQSHVNQFLPPIEQFRQDAPSDLNMILQRATSKDPDARYTDIRQFAKDFRQLIQPHGTVDAVPHLFTLADEIMNPYMGLRPYGETDSEFFFGRTALVIRLIERLTEDTELNNFLALVGPSGSGKSSVIYAGLIPQLKAGAITGSDSWYVTTMTPSSQPFQNLILALRSIAAVAVDDFTQEIVENSQSLNQLMPSLMGHSDNHLLLFIDQFEELFTQVDDEDTRQKFLNLLIRTVQNPTSNIQIIITMRADFYDKPLQYEEFGKLMQARTEVILPLDSGELERVIAGPAQRVGLEVETELIAEIISDVRAEPGALPLLQYTLTELFNRREDLTLTLSTYRDSGGVRGALARRADDVYQSLSESQKQVARQIFLRLVTLGEGTEDTRRRAHFSELHSITNDLVTVNGVLDEFNHYRLLTFDRDPETREPTVEVAHEALIREWRQFQIWLDASRDDLRLQRLIATEVNDWKENNKDTSYLLRGNRLAHFEHWMDTSNVLMSQEEIAFLKASVEEQQREERDKIAHQQKEMRLMHQASQRLRAIVVILLIASIGGMVLTAAIIKQNQDIQQERDIAINAEAEAASHLKNAYSSAFSTTARQAYGEGDYQLALAFAYEAAKLDEESDIAYSTLSEIAFSAGISHIIENDDLSPVYDIAMSQDGKTAIGVGGTDYLDIFDNYLPSEERRKAGNPSSSEPIDFTTIDFGQLPPSIIRIWDTDTGEVRLDLRGHDSTITSLGLIEADDAPMIAYAATILGDVYLWDTATGDMVKELEPLPHGNNRLSITQDGRLMLGTNGSQIDTQENRLVIWDVATGQIIQQFEPHASGLWDSALQADGKQAISIYLDGTQVVWDTETGEVIQELHVTPHNIRQSVYQIRMSNDGFRAITNVGSGEVYIWEYERGEFELDELAYKFAEIFDVGVSDDGQRALMLQTDGLMVDWDLDSEELNEILEERGQALESVDLSADGNVAVVGRSDGSVLIWDLSNTPPDLAQEFPEVESDMVVTFLPFDDVTNEQHILVFDGQLSPSGTSSTLSIWDVESGEMDVLWDTPHVMMPSHIAVDDTGKFALTSTTQHPTIFSHQQFIDSFLLWDLNDGEILHEITPEFQVTDAKFVPNSTDPLLAITNWGNGVALWDMNEGKILQKFETKDAVAQIQISPNTEFLFAVTRDGQLVQWNFESGETVATYDIGRESFLFELNPETSWIASGYNEKDIAIWNYETQELVTVLQGHTGTVLSADFTYSLDWDDEEYLQMISSDINGNILYWDMESFTAFASLVYASRVRLEISPDGVYHTVAPAIGILDVLYVVLPEENDVFTFIENNRIVDELTLQDCILFGIEEVCQETIMPDAQ